MNKSSDQGSQKLLAVGSTLDSYETSRLEATSNFMQDPELFAIFEQCVVKAFEKVLGGESAITPYHSLIAKIENPAEFQIELRGMFGLASSMFEKEILNELYRESNLQFKTENGYQFPDYVQLVAKTLIEERRSHSPRKMTTPTLELLDVESVTTEKENKSRIETLQTPKPRMLLPEEPNDRDVMNAVSGLLKESLQIIELMEMEKQYSDDVVSRFQDVIKQIDESSRIKHNSIANDHIFSDVVLTPRAAVRIFRGSELITSVPVESMMREPMVEILGDILPKVESLLKERSQNIVSKTTTFEKIVNKVRKFVAPQ